MSHQDEKERVEIVADADKTAVSSTERRAGTTTTTMKIGDLIVGKYSLEVVIGHGGMGTVFRAKQVALNKTVALKVLNSDMLFDGSVTARFKREAESAAQLQHPNLIGVHDYGVTDGDNAYLVMDYVDGESLSRIIKRDGPLAPERALAIVRQVADGLAHAHAKGVVHRDIKPSNIIIVRGDNGDEIAKVVDFGLAKALASPDSNSVTKTGDVFGTPHYMSPEQCNGQPTDGRSDIYSLGCVLFEALEGKPPFNADSAIAAAVMHLHHAVPRVELKGVRPDIANSINAIIERAMAKKTEDRFQTAAEMSNSIALAATGAFKSKPRQKWLAAGIAGGALVAALLIAGICAFVVFKPQDTANPPIPAPVVSAVPEVTMPTPKDVEEQMDTADEIFARGQETHDPMYSRSAAELYAQNIDRAAELWKGQKMRIFRAAQCYMLCLTNAFPHKAKIDEKHKVARLMLANSDPDSMEQGEAWRYEGAAYMDVGEGKLAREAYERAKAIYIKRPDQLDYKLHTMRIIGESYMWQPDKDWQTAANLLTTARREMGKVPHKSPWLTQEFAATTADLGYAKGCLHKLSESESLLMQAATDKNCPGYVLNNILLWAESVFGKDSKQYRALDAAVRKDRVH